MDCELLKIDKNVCLRDETDHKRKDYVKVHGIEKYKEVQGLNLPEGKPSVDDHSRTTSLGLINIETKREMENLNKLQGLGWKEIIKLVVAVLIIL